MNWKTIAGLLLVILSIAGMYFWETEGRDNVVLTRTLVSARVIEEGERISPSDFKTVKITHDAVVSEPLAESQIPMIAGLAASRRIPANQQVCLDDFIDPSLVPDEGDTLFVLPESWIYSRSGFTAVGDRVSLYLLPDKIYMGNYLAAYVEEDRVEIYCELEEYYSIYDAVSEVGPGSLLIVLEDEVDG